MMADNLDIEIWLEFAQADIETAKLVFKNSENYHIAVYHAHQAIEKIIKRQYLLIGKQFEFIHDIVQLLLKLDENSLGGNYDNFINKASIMMRLYNDTRYPKGDKISFDDAQLAIQIADEMVDFFKLKR